MNWFDLVILIIVCLGVYSGIRKGFIRSLFELIALFSASIIAYNWFMDAGELVGQYIKISARIIYFITYSLIWLISFFSINMLGKLIQKAIKKTFLSHINIIAGIIFGFFKGCFFASFFVIPVVVFSSMFEPIKEYTHKSVVIKTSQPFMENLMGHYNVSDVPSLIHMTQDIGIDNISEYQDKIMSKLSKKDQERLSNLSKELNKTDHREIESLLKNIDPENLAELIKITERIKSKHNISNTSDTQKDISIDMDLLEKLLKETKGKTIDKEALLNKYSK